MSDAMTEIRCWRCEKKLAEVMNGSSGEVRIICPKCGAKNRQPLDSAKPSALVFA